MNRRLTGGSVLALALATTAFTPPDRRVRTMAAGSMARLDPAGRRAFSDAGEFHPKKEPGPVDWLAVHDEKGQTYGQYLASGANLPDGRRNKLYILPLGDFEAGRSPALGKLREFAAAYFHPLEVGLLEPVPDAGVKAGSRVHAATGRKQWNSRDLLRWLPKQLPADGYAMLAVTMTDLYPDEGWNFVFGQASIKKRVGVFSFARYHPSWYGEQPGPDTEKLVLRRASKVLTHEMGHMFGIRHCIYYECNMNGANGLEEMESTPMHLCPVCLRKLARAAGFEPAVRYAALARVYGANGFDEEKAWVEARERAIRAAGR